MSTTFYNVSDKNLITKKHLYKFHNQYFLLFQEYFHSILSQSNSTFGSHLFCRLQMLSIWTCLKFGHFVNSLSLYLYNCDFQQPRKRRLLKNSEIEALECLYRSTGLIFLQRWRKVFNLYLRNIPVKFGKNPVKSFWGEVFQRKSSQMDVLLSLYKSIIHRLIKEIWFHKFNLPKFWCIMHFSYEITLSTKGK